MTLLLKGIKYNFRGLFFGLKTPSLFLWGLARLAITLVLALLAIGLVLSKHQEIANLIWPQPEDWWILWLWHIVSWLLVLLLAAMASLMAFLFSQLLFIILIMDHMSRITERKTTGNVIGPPKLPVMQHYVSLLKQEIPRAIIPITITMGLMVIGWLTPLSPVLTIITPIIAATFLAWDNTDLVSARRLAPFGSRFRFLRQNLIFHMGFGLGFLIPGLNILLLSYAPVGGTLFYVEEVDKASPPSATAAPQKAPIEIEAIDAAESPHSAPESATEESDGAREEP